MNLERLRPTLPRAQLLHQATLHGSEAWVSHTLDGSLVCLTLTQLGVWVFQVGLDAAWTLSWVFQVGLDAAWTLSWVPGVSGGARCCLQLYPVTSLQFSMCADSTKEHRETSCCYVSPTFSSTTLRGSRVAPWTVYTQLGYSSKYCFSKSQLVPLIPTLIESGTA